MQVIFDLLESVFSKIDSDNRQSIFLTLYFCDDSVALCAKSSKLRPLVFFKIREQF